MYSKGKITKPYWMLALAVVAAVAVFSFDWLVELGVAAAVPYVIVVWFVAATERRKGVWAAAIICTLLTCLGFVISPSGGELWKVLANRGLALMAIWLTALLCVRNITLLGDRAEKRARSVIEAAPTAMVMVDREGRIVLVNAETEKLFGYTRDELHGQPVEMLVPERFQPQHPSYRAAYFANPAARRMGEGRDLFAVRKDGSEFPVEISLNAVETDTGLLVLSSIVDISERKRLEVAERQRTAELAMSNEALENSNMELQQFAYIASHDLQAPLRGVAGFAQFLQKDYQGRLDEKADDYIEQIVKGIKRMQTLISDLLTFSRVESRSAPFRPISLNKVFDDAVSLLHASIEDAGGKVTRDELPTVTGDRSQLSQLLQNLIGNGIKYYADKTPRVHVSAKQNAHAWIVAVRDNGIGIKARYHERIFEIFRRLHSADKYPGTGIGLAVCRRIVHRHGGTIWLESDHDKGSTFYFSIPNKGSDETQSDLAGPEHPA